MSQNTQWDSLDYEVLNFPYNRIETEFSPEPRIFRGLNSYITRGGKLGKRPGTLNLDSNNALTGRIDRLWSYETLESPPNIYLVASVFTGPYWELRYKHIASPVTGWQTPPNYRQSNFSTAPHELAISRGLAYIKGYPTTASGEKLGTVILDGAGGSIAIKPWGILGPQTAARISGAKTALAADIDNTTTTITVDSDSGFPATPFSIQIGYEQLTVTAGIPGTSWTVTRGANGTTAVPHSADEPVIWLNWTTSDHIVEVNYGWRYAYAYKTITGQISNRSPDETNPDFLPSFTGPFFDLIPKITLQGHADTTNVPTIIVYRTTDGGGTFYNLEEIPNPGAGSFVYSDDSLGSGPSGTVFADPLPDAFLDQQNLGPSTTSNSPPPAVLAPLITGVDTPARTTPIVAYQGRLWYAIGNVLFFSAQEELNEGIPEESFPSGAANGRNGNFFRFQYPIINLSETKEALYVFTIQATFRITGSNLETFSPDPAFENFGAPPGHPRAITRFGDTVAFLTHDYRVCLIERGNIRQISDPLWTDLVDVLNLNAEFDFKYFGDLDKEWLVISSHRKTGTLASQQWIYDIQKSEMIRKPFWFTPWTIRSVAMASTRASEVSSQRRLIFAVYDETTQDCALVRLDPTARTGSDYFLTEAISYNFYVDFHQMTIPPGNHVNGLRAPNVTPVVYGVTLDRVLFASDNDPDVSFYFDDLWTDPAQAKRVENPPRRTLSKGYKTLLYTIHRACQHFSVRIAKVNSFDLFELMRLTVIWDPDSGA